MSAPSPARLQPAGPGHPGARPAGIGMDQVPFGPFDLLVPAGRGGHPDRGQRRGRLRVHDRARPRPAARPAAARGHQPGVRGDRDQRAGRAGVQRRVQHRADPCHVHRGAAPPRGAGRQGGRARRGDARRRRGGRVRLVRPGPGRSWRATARACRWGTPGFLGRCYARLAGAYARCSAWPSARSSGTPRAASPPPSR